MTTTQTQTYRWEIMEGVSDAMKKLIQIQKCGGRRTIGRRYRGQMRDQPCYIYLDLRDGTVWAHWSREIGNSTPTAEWFSCVRRFPIPSRLKGTKVNRIMADIAKDLQAILDGSDCVWHNGQWRGVLSEAAQQVEIDLLYRFATDRDFYE